jgi:hypothetical protein
MDQHVVISAEQNSVGNVCATAVSCPLHNMMRFTPGGRFFAAGVAAAAEPVKLFV